MATACERLDELVKEYLLFRGFTTTAKALDHEIKHDKDRELRADRMVEQLMSYVGSHDLQHLREYWAHLNHRFFCRLEQRYAASVRKLEVSLLKLYVVNAQQSSHQDRVRDFFEKIGAELQNQIEFRDWFVFPFVSNPAENGNFALYFTRQWQETVQLSLHNFLQVVLQAMPVPTLLNFDHDARKMQALLEENENLRNQLAFCSAGPEKKVYRAKGSDHMSFAQPLPDLIYDFSGLADGSHEGSTEIVSSERQKTPRRFPITLSTPLLKRNKQQQQQQQHHHHQQTDAVRQDLASGSNAMLGGGGQSNQSLNNASQEIQSSQSLCHVASVQSSQHISGGLHTVSGGSFSGIAPVVSSSSSPSLLSQHSGTMSSTGQKANVLRSMSEPQEASLVQQSGPPGEGAPGPVSKKKGPRELTSFPPYASPQFEAPVSGRSGSVVATIPELPPPGQPSQGNRSATFTGASSVEAGGGLLLERGGLGGGGSGSCSEHKGVVESLLPIPEGKQCPFLVLSDDVYSEHRSAVVYSRFSITGHHVASLDMDGIVKVWTWSPQPCTSATIMSRAPFLSLDWASKSDRWLLLGSQSGQIRLFDTREIKTFREASVDSPNLRVTYLSTCPSTMMFASSLCAGDFSAEAGRLALWDLKTMKIERYLPLEPQPVWVTSCMHSSSGKLLLAAGSDGCVRLYDLAQRQCVRKWRVGKTPQQTVQFASQDLSFCSMGTEGVLSEWSITNAEQPLRQVLMVDSGGLPSAGTAQFSQPPAVAASVSRGGQLFSLSKDRTYLLFARHRQGAICKMGEGPARGGLHRILDLSAHSDVVTTVDWSPCIDTPVCLTGARDAQLRVATLLSQ